MPDRFDEIAAILIQQPDLDQLDGRTDATNTHQLNDLLAQRRQQVADRLRTSARSTRTDSDPVLAALQTTHRQRLEAESTIRLLLAYAREFIEPRPYRLVDLAQATGMSISGVRTAYAADDIERVAAAIERPPQTNPHAGETLT